MFVRRIIVALFGLLLLQIEPVFAQSTVSQKGFAAKKQAALEELKQYPNPDTNRINALIKVVSTGVFLKEREELIAYRMEAGLLSRRLRYTKGLAFYYFATGNYYKSASKYQDALRFYDSTSMICANSTDPRLIELSAACCEMMGAIYYGQENYYMALDHFFESLKYSAYNPSGRNVRLNIFITEIYTLLNNTDKATEYGLRAIEMAEKDSVNAPLRGSVYLAFVKVSLEKNDFESATFYLDKISQLLSDPDEILLFFGYYMGRGHVNYKQGKYEVANMYYMQANKYALLSGHDGSKSAVLQWLSKTALKLGDNEMARKYATENLAFAEQLDAKADQVEALINLSEYYSTRGDKANAFDFMQKATKLKDSLNAQKNHRQINILGAMYETDKQQKEITRLQSEKDLQTADVKHKSVLNKVFIGSILLLLFLGYLGYVNFRRGQQLARHEHEMHKQKIIELEKDKQLLTIDAMLKGQEDERSRIAKDLHDGLGSLLSGTKLSFMNVKENLLLSPEHTKLFDKSISMLDNTIGDLRKVAQNLMPEALVKFGLQDAVRDFCDTIQSTSGLKVNCQHFGAVRRLDNTAEVFIYRIIQELVNNVIKHAEAKEVIIQLTFEPTKIRITVEDDGKGFDKGILTNATGAGMANINYRMQYFNGSSDIITEPGKGTSVNIELML